MRRLSLTLSILAIAVLAFTGHAVACHHCGDTYYFCYEDNSTTSMVNKTTVPPELTEVPLGDTPRGTGGKRNILPSPQVFFENGVKIHLVPTSFLCLKYAGDNYYDIHLPQGVAPITLINQSESVEERKEGLIISGEDPQDAIRKLVLEAAERFNGMKEIVILVDVTYDAGTNGKTFVLPGTVSGGTNPVGVGGAGVGKWVSHEDKSVVLTATYYEVMMDPVPCVLKKAETPPVVIQERKPVRKKKPIGRRRPKKLCSDQVVDYLDSIQGIGK